MLKLLILLAVSLAVSAVGWKYFIYFFSIGYGYSVVALAVAMGVLYYAALTPATIALLLLMVIFGMRLGTYLFMRERKSAAYRKILYGGDAPEKKPAAAMSIIWISCALLYVMQVSPVAFRLMNGVQDSETWAWIGTAVMLCGILLEAGSDAQSPPPRNAIPNALWIPVSTALYAVPNYLGEVLIWTGVMLSAIGAGLVWWQWMIAALGYICIVYVMFSGARRLEIRQNAAYGADPEYQAYIKKTPILIPLLPIYSVARYEWLKA